MRPMRTAVSTIACLGVAVLLGLGGVPARPAAAGQARPLSVLVLLGEWFGDAYFPLAKEIEARGWTMKRAGVDVEYRGCYNKARDVVLRSDILIPDLKDFSGYDALIIPSGPQWRKFNENPTVLEFVRRAHAAGLIVASFCVGNTTVKAAGLIDLPTGPELYPDKVTLVKERVLIGPRGGGPPPGDGFESAPIKDICDAVAREVAAKKASAAPIVGRIHEAVRAGDLAKVKALVAESPAVVNEKDDRGRTPLHFASVSEKPDVLAFLIASGADVKAADPEGFTPLHWAASEGRAGAAKALIAAGADPNALSYQRVSPLESAFYGHRPEAIEALLQGGLKVESRGDEGGALLHRAAQAGFPALVDHLLQNGAAPASRNAYGGTLLHSAAAGGIIALVDKLIAGGANVNNPDDVGQTPLHMAAASGRADMVDHLISKGADTTAVCRDGRTLMHCAAMGGLVGLMDRLAKSGFPVDAPDRYGRTPLLKAAEAGQDKAAEFLLSRGANVMSRDFFQQTALHEAAFSGNLALLDLLVKRGADIDALNQEGSTPLLSVTQAGREDVIERLLALGAKLDVRNKYNETPLTFPLGNGFVDLVEKLWPRAEALKNKDLLEKYPLHRVAYLGIARSAEFLVGKNLPLDLQDESGRTPFQRAAQGGNVEIAQWLLARGAKVDASDPQGSTPLHLAVKKGRKDMVRFLIEKGASPRAQDGRGRTPVELAEEYVYPEVADVLLKAGAEPAAATTDVASLLAKHLNDGQAVIWSLGHCGFAVKTRSRLLIFDYFSRGWPRPARPSLANGFIDPEEIKDLDVTVFVSHSHGDHFDPVILEWRSTIKNVRYVFGWNAGKGGRTIDLPAPRASISIGGMEVFTVNGEHNDVPETAYLVKADGLSIYHAGDYISPTAAFKTDMDYLRAKAGRIDLAFISRFEQAEALAPAVVFPMHAYNREYMYEAFAREAEEKKLPSRVIRPENKGDRFELFDDPVSRPELTGPYLGQKPPGLTPEVFAPGIASSADFIDFKGAFSPDGREYYFYRHALPEIIPTLLVTKIENGIWTEPAPLPIAQGARTYHPCVSPDNQWLFFYWQFQPERQRPSGFYASARTEAGWSAPSYAGPGMYLTCDDSGRFYTTDSVWGDQPKHYLASMTFSQGRFSRPERLTIQPHFGNQTHPCIAPDGSYIIFDINVENGSLYVSFKDKEGQWGRGIDLTKHGFKPDTRGAYISPDGKYLFFSVDGDIWWVSSKVIEALRPK
jgi:ankyrin repeat protein/L-ascorbate metabolism protein UlaG (beta-lactamase superfamily)